MNTNTKGLRKNKSVLFALQNFLSQADCVEGLNSIITFDKR